MVNFTHPLNQLLQKVSIPKIVALATISILAITSTNVSAQVSGNVFRDFNANGSKEASSSYNEPGVSGITVTAYDAAGTILATTTTDASGNFSFSSGQVSSGTKARIEFTAWKSADYPAALGLQNASSVQFVTAPSTAANFAINYPGDYFSNSNPKVIIPGYSNGNNRVSGSSAASSDAVYAYNYDLSGSVDILANLGQIGSVWATAYHRKADKMFYAAFVKRHVALGSLGTAGIYVTNNAKSANNTTNTTTFVNLNAVNSAFDAGTVTRNFNPGNGDKSQANYDEEAFDAVGKKGIGGMSISDDGKYLYLVNLNDRRLWRVEVGENGTAPTSASQIQQYSAVPPSSGGGQSFRIFAVKYYRGDIYVGCVNDGVHVSGNPVNRDNLMMYVYKVGADETPGSATFDIVLQAPLTYDRRANLNSGYGGGKNTVYTDPNGTNNALSNTAWHPWARTFAELLVGGSATKPMYPQPILSGIEFDPIDGSMILGLMDRTGHQTGNENFGTNTASTTLYTGNAAGDILKAENVGGNYSNFTLESNGTVGGVTSVGAGNNEGPNGGEYYFTDRFRQAAGGALGISDVTSNNEYLDHEETSTGSLGLVAGKGEVLTTAFDPIDAWNSGGIRYYNNANGIATKGKKLYEGMNVDVFGKANGLGDIEFITAPAPIEIGNRLWKDADGDGVQDADELPFAGVTVQLLQGTTVIATAVTDANGVYVFSSDASRTSTSSAIYNISTLTNNTTYTVRVPNISGSNKQSALANYGLTIANNATGSNADEIDSDGIAINNHADVVVTTTIAGANNHSVDFGFVNCGTGSVTASYTSTSVTVANTPCLDNNQVTFVSTSTGAATYFWNFDNGSTATVANPSAITYTTAGSYNVKLVVESANGCKDSITQVVVIASCSTGSGGGGGVESKSLGDVIGKRNFAFYKNGENGEVVDYSRKEKIVSSFASDVSVAVNNVQTNNAAGTSLASVMPFRVDPSFTQYVTSPTDLVNFTNAIEVRSIDFTKNSLPKAVAFATKTLGGVYTHTKPICDRLRGAQLLKVETVVIENYNFVRYTLRQENGSVEYAISFSAGKKVGRNSFSIQSNWMTKDYIGEDTLFNYQLWAASPVHVSTMVSEVLSRLKGAASILPQTAISGLPNAYISEGNRKGTALNLVVNNGTNFTSGYFEIDEKRNENAPVTTRIVPFTVTAKNKTNVTIPVSDNYEADIRMIINNKIEDIVYMADGIWGVDYDKSNSSVAKFEVVNDASRTYTNDEYPLLRNVNIEATSKSYISVYKFLRGGGSEQNLSDFKSIRFNAQSNASNINLRITITKKGITNWANQYTYLIKGLSNTSKEYLIGLDEFKSAGTTDKLVASDITSIIYNYEIEGGNNTNFTASLSNVAFSKADAVYLRSLEAKTVTVFPNPNFGKFSVSFMSDKDAVLQLDITDITGRTISKRVVNAVKGSNLLNIELNGAYRSNVYVISLSGKDGKYNTQKITINPR
ncbi:MAG: SdrD B-like domain-containing protein [Chitinophagaceae bacterium]